MSGSPKFFIRRRDLTVSELKAAFGDMFKRLVDAGAVFPELVEAEATSNESVCRHLQATTYFCIGEWTRVCQDCGAHVSGEGGVNHG